MVIPFNELRDGDDIYIYIEREREREREREWRTKCHTIDCARNTFLLLLNI